MADPLHKQKHFLFDFLVKRDLVFNFIFEWVVCDVTAAVESVIAIKTCAKCLQSIADDSSTHSGAIIFNQLLSPSFLDDSTMTEGKKILQITQTFGEILKWNGSIEAST